MPLSLRSHQRELFLCLGLLIVVGCTFAPCLQNGFVNFDDDIYIYENSHIQAGLSPASLRWAWTTMHGSNWHPLTWVSLLLDRQFFGMWPGGYHLTSVLLHAAATVLLFLLLAKMTAAIWPSAAVAVLFALHPLHVESVAWAAERKDVLCACFWMLSLLMYVLYARNHASNSARYYAGALGFFACALMSKPMAVTMPALLLLLDWWPLQRFQPANSAPANSLPRLLLEKLPFLALALISSGLTLLAQQHGGSLRTIARFPITERISNALVSYAVYALKTIWPSGLCVYYPYRAFPVWMILAAIGFFIGMGIFAWKALHRFPYVTFGWLWYVITLVPVLGLIQVGGQSHADRYSYVPLIGLFVAFAWSAEQVTRCWPRRAAIAAILCGLLLSCCIGLTGRQIAYWHDNESLYRRALAVTPDNHVALNNLAVALLRQGRMGEALPLFREAVRVEPGFALAHLGLADSLAANRQNQEALIHYQRSLELDPNYLETYIRFSTALGHQGRFEEALPLVNKALQLKPNSSEAHCTLGTLLAMQGQMDQATNEFHAALRIAPTYRAARINLASTLALKGSLNEAIAQFQQVLQSEPNDSETHCDLGDALALSGRLEEAEGEYGEALRLNSQNARAHAHLGNALFRRGYSAEAVTQYQKALQLNPTYDEARTNLLRAWNDSKQKAK